MSSLNQASVHWQQAQNGQSTIAKYMGTVLEEKTEKQYLLSSLKPTLFEASYTRTVCRLVVPHLYRVRSGHPGKVPFIETLFKPLVSSWLWRGPEFRVGSRPGRSWRQESTNLRFSWCWDPQHEPPSWECSLFGTVASRAGCSGHVGIR